MRHRIRPSTCAWFFFLTLISTAAWGRDTTQTIRDIVTARRHPDLAWSDLSDVGAELETLYPDGATVPLWLPNGRPSPQAQAIVAEMLVASQRGLNPSDYDANLLSERIAQPSGDEERIGTTEVALSVSILRFLRHIYLGRIAPRGVGFGIDAPPKDIDLVMSLRNVAAVADPKAELAALDPPFPLYERLVESLVKYRELSAQDFVEIGDIPTLKPDEHQAIVPALRARLIALGDANADLSIPEDPSLYDGATVAAMKSFQRRHGLEADGIIGRGTLAALRVPIEQRTTQIELAMERLRWLPRQTSDRFIIVNIPEFRLSAFEVGHPGPVMSSDVVVGSAARKHETPILNAEMKYIVFRPYWNVPPGIMNKEIRPKLNSDPGYLERHDMEMVGSRVRQRPGEDNSLGLVKFIFPNPHHVYLHDTPSKDLFGRARRDFSHGCIRVGSPVELAEFVLTGQGDWTRDDIIEAMKSGRDDHHVRLDIPIPVYLLYSTVIVTREGELRFFDDLYKHDAELQKALAKGSPYK